MTTLHLRRHLAAWSLLLLLYVHLSPATETTTKPASDEDDSSSEETVEDSGEEAERRRRRHAAGPVEDSGEDSKGNNNPTNNNAKTPRAGLPALPDPATILKIAEILQTVGEKVIPILIQGNEATAAIAQRLGQQFQFLNMFRREIDQFTQSLVGGGA